MSIAKALAGNAKVLIPDEPSAILTAAEIEVLFAVVQRFAESGVSVVYISHRLNDLFRITQQVELVLSRLACLGKFHGIDVQVKQGRIIGLYGLVGSGVPEIAACIYGMDQAMTGQILLYSKAISPHGNSAMPSFRPSCRRLVNGKRATTLTVATGGAPATVLLDYGKEVSGTPYIKVNSATASAVQLAFSETRQYLFSPGSSTLAADVPARAKTVTVSQSSTFSVGDKIAIGSESNKITGVTGTTLTLAKGLRSAVVAGTQVTSTPGALTGDSSGFAGYPRTESVPLTASATLSGIFQGGQRFETITVSTPGTVTLGEAGIHFQAYRATPDQYQGHFLSSSDSLNKMWYDWAYTQQVNMQPAGVYNNSSEPSVLDGAKRDRAIGSGDLYIAGPGIISSLGSNGSEYVKQSLLRLITSSTAGSGLNGQTLFGANGAGPWGHCYSSWTVIAATDYVRYTGDTLFAEKVLPYLEGQLSYDATLANEQGLIAVTGAIGTAGGIDSDPYDSLKSGVVASYNMLYSRTLLDVAYLESLLGNSVKAAEYQVTATMVKDTVNANFYNATTGAYDSSETVRNTIAQDANSLALLFDIAPKEKNPRDRGSAQESLGTERFTGLLGRRQPESTDQPFHDWN